MPSFGEELRRERELREISLREVAEATKIQVRYLEAMERNDFSVLPGGVYNKGFVRQYCDFIGVDAESMINAYLLEEQVRTVAEPASDGLLRGGGGPRRRDRAPSADAAPVPARSRARRVALVLLLAAAAVATYFLLGAASDGPPSSPAGRAVTEQPDE